MLSVSTVSHQNEQPCQTGWYLLQHPQIVYLDEEGLVGFSDCIEAVNAALEHLFFEQHAGKKGFVYWVGYIDFSIEEFGELVFRGDLRKELYVSAASSKSTGRRRDSYWIPTTRGHSQPSYSKSVALVTERITFAKDQNCTNQSYHRTATARI